MFGYRCNNIQEVVERLQQAENSAAFDTAMSAAKDYLKQLEVSSECLLELERRAYYFPNDYSEKDTRQKMHEAKMRVIEYLDNLMNQTMDDKILLQVLENFYLFLESFLERVPHKKAGIQKEQLENIRIKNEYDVQHFLYAYLKPLYPMARTEVSEDTGYHTVRADIVLGEDMVIEVKCTRAGMSQRKLLEEIGADMVCYNSKCIYFFIYDKEKVIENPMAFRVSGEKRMKEKEIHIILYQPKILP